MHGNVYSKIQKNRKFIWLSILFQLVIRRWFNRMGNPYIERNYMAQMNTYPKAKDALGPERAAAYVEGAKILATGPDGNGNQVNLNIPIDDLRGDKTAEWDNIQGKPEFADVAFSGDYNDLDNKPEQPVLAEVATSGDYNDLDNKPEIPPAQVHADWSQTNSNSPSFIENKPDLDEYVKGEDLNPVATSGDYDDLSNKPSIPTGVKVNGSTKNPDSNGIIDIGTVLTEHQDVSEKANKSEMKIEAVSGDSSKKKITLKTNLSADVLVAHQDVSGKAEKSEMNIEAVSGDSTKKKITLKSGMSADVLVAHQDISSKITNPPNGSAGDVLKKTANGVEWGSAGGGGGGGMTMGQTITIQESQISGGGEYDTYVDIAVANNTYTIVEIPSGLTAIDAIHLNITTADLPNFIVHFKLKDTTQYQWSGIAAEVHYKASASSEEILFDHHREAGYDGDCERAPFIYAPSDQNGFTGDNILTCIGRYFEIKSLFSHVPPSGSWNGIYS